MECCNYQTPFTTGELEELALKLSDFLRIVSDDYGMVCAKDKHNPKYKSLDEKVFKIVDKVVNKLRERDKFITISPESGVSGSVNIPLNELLFCQQDRKSVV